MSTRQVEIFVMVARLASFSVAAARLHIAQSAVSIAVRRLEESLGARLFDRDQRHVALTPAGQLYLARVQPALAALERARREVRSLEAGLHGTVTIAAPAMVTQAVFAAPLVDFQRNNPGVKLIVRQGGANDIERLVLAGDVELGVVADVQAVASLAVVELLTLQSVACGPLPASSPAPTWRDLLAGPLVTFPVGYQQRQLVEARAKDYGIAPRIVLESEHVAVLLEAVRAGLGMTTLPEPATKNAGVAVYDLEEAQLLRVNLCHRRDYPLTRAAQALVDHLCGAGRAGDRAHVPCDAGTRENDSLDEATHE